MSEKRWRVWRSDEPDGEAEAVSFAEKPCPWLNRRLHDAQEAAEWWAETDDQNSAEYAIVAQRDEPVVTVEDRQTGKRSHWRVQGEAVPEYRAHPWENEQEHRDDG